MKDFWVYTGLRFLLFLASLAVVFGIWSVVAPESSLFWPVVVALLLSGVASYFLLNRQRIALARRVESRVEHLKTKEDVD